MLRKLHKFLSGFSEFKVYMFFVDSPTHRSSPELPARCSEQKHDTHYSCPELLPSYS